MTMVFAGSRWSRICSWNHAMAALHYAAWRRDGTTSNFKMAVRTSYIHLGASSFEFAFFFFLFLLLRDLARYHCSLSS